MESICAAQLFVELRSAPILFGPFFPLRPTVRFALLDSPAFHAMNPLSFL
jgi:hypothetical protein